MNFFYAIDALHIRKALPPSLKDAELDAGTAIICFSRRDVLSIKGELEQHHKYKVSVIYGGLSPEVRRIEAQRFRDKETDKGEFNWDLGKQFIQESLLTSVFLLLVIANPSSSSG